MTPTEDRFEDTDCNGNPDVTVVLRIIDDKRSRYEVAKAVAEWHQAAITAAMKEFVTKIKKEGWGDEHDPVVSFSDIDKILANEGSQSQQSPAD